MTETSPAADLLPAPARHVGGAGDDVHDPHRPAHPRGSGAGRRRRRGRSPGTDLDPARWSCAAPTITGTYFRTDRVTLADKFRDGWLRTGDLGVIHPAGWVELKDRLKDGIKSGGEWISSVELENAVAEHPAVAEVAVIGDPRPAMGGAAPGLRQTPSRAGGLT